jgi:superfamily II DNA or RNA helicase
VHSAKKNLVTWKKLCKLSQTEMEIIAGTPVWHRSDPGRLGVLTGRTLQAMFLMAEVNWGNRLEFVDVSQLAVFEENVPRDSDHEVRSGRYGTIDDLRRRITFEKLRGLLTDVFYSMKTSEIDFYAHQFKPVVRFTESATNRLLIADEVGLGKTIEAGLIWTEWKARQKARRLLVVCPPMLCPKWLRELQERFQLSAEETDSHRILDLLGQFDRRGPSLSFVLVTSYHALRPFRRERVLLDELRKGGGEKEALLKIASPRVKLLHRLREWDAAEPFFDMVVFDEMHTMKETGTSSHFMGQVLGLFAGAVVGLSATPIHNKSRDLFALLNLIDPEVFRDEQGFNELRRQNLPIVQLQNVLASPTWKPADIQPLIEELPSAQAQKKIVEFLRNFDGSAGQRVELRHTVERMNLLGNFINRTRKRDVLENRVIRQAVTFSVFLRPEEVSFYKRVLALVRKEVRKRGDQVTSFHLIHPALQMSSSLPVVAAAVRKGKWGGFDELGEIADDFEKFFDLESDAPPPSPESLKDLTEFDFEKHDSKYEALLKALRLITPDGELHSDKGEPLPILSSDKVIIFAFFKSTIAYLQRRLLSDGFKTTAVTGDIKDRNERDQILREFASDENRILLCSEIGAEGVDLQFARIVVNYDLPWNPMRVEQRIGRIDRIGQESHSIVIINFHVRDTIDGNIFSHLYAKIGVFEHTIGALEGILGEEVAKLTAQIFRDELSSEQIAERAEQTADAVCQRAKTEEELEGSTGALIAFQDVLSEQIGESQRLGRFIKPTELRLHAQDFFAAKYKGRDACLLVWDNPERECVQIKLSFAAMSDFETFCQVQQYIWPDGFSRSTRSVSITFDPAVHQRWKRRFPQLTLVTHLHPFFRWITKENEQGNNEWHKVSAVSVEAPEFSPGRYFYLVYRLTLEQITRRDAFHYAIKNLTTNEVITGLNAESLLNLALERGKSAFFQSVGDHHSDLLSLRAALAADLRSAQVMFREAQAQKLDIRRQRLSSHFDRLIDIQKRRIATAEQGGAEAHRGLPGFKRRLENLESEHDHQLALLSEKTLQITENFAEIACGLLEVTPC